MIPSHLFEWFYFDVHQQDGFDFVLSFHTLPFMSQFEVSIFDLFVYRENQPFFHKYFAIPLNQFEFEQGRKKIVHPKDPKLLFSRSKNLVKIDAQTRRYELKLKMINQAKDDRIQELDLFTDVNDQQSFSWHLYMPQARAEGVFRYLDESENKWKEITISGKGYHDANRGNVNLKKELKSWIWMKIYFNDELWIVGKIILLKGKEFNVLVKSLPSKQEYTTKANIELNSKRIEIKSPIGNLKVDFTKTVQIDDLRFLVPSFRSYLGWAGKIREVLAAVSLENNPMKVFRNILTNGKYRRHRWWGKTGGGKQVEIFGEEMILNE
ncbi:MAG: hypothetical protein GXO77_02625 [Calditrichaeota bacterium]|nr:hypothetical protein [Calditrichota bacterium]